MKNTTKPYRPSFLTTLLYGIAANVPRKEGAIGILRGIILGSGLLMSTLLVIVITAEMYLTPADSWGSIGGRQVSEPVFCLLFFGPGVGMIWYHCNSARFKRNARLFLGTPELRRASQKRGWVFILFMVIAFGVMLRKQFMVQ
jgi:hypothetical protein